jgi:hypothetical protein
MSPFPFCTKCATWHAPDKHFHYGSREDEIFDLRAKLKEAYKEIRKLRKDNRGLRLLS